MFHAELSGSVLLYAHLISPARMMNNALLLHPILIASRLCPNRSDRHLTVNMHALVKMLGSLYGNSDGSRTETNPPNIALELRVIKRS